MNPQTFVYIFLFIIFCTIVVLVADLTQLNTESFQCPSTNVVVKPTKQCKKKVITTQPTPSPPTIIKTSKCCKKTYCPACPQCPPACPRMCPDLSKYILKSSIPPCSPQAACPSTDDVCKTHTSYMLKDECTILNQTSQTSQTSQTQSSTQISENNQNIPDMSKYILKSELPDMNNYILKSKVKKVPKSTTTTSTSTTSTPPPTTTPTSTSSCKIPTPILDAQLTGAAFPFASLTGFGTPTPGDGSSGIVHTNTTNTTNISLNS